MRKMIQKVPHPLIEEWAHLHYQLDNAIHTHTAMMTDDELEALIHAATSLTDTNCWYAEYNVKDLVLEQTAYQQRARKARRDQEAALSAAPSAPKEE